MITIIITLTLEIPLSMRGGATHPRPPARIVATHGRTDRHSAEAGTTITDKPLWGCINH